MGFSLENLGSGGPIIAVLAVLSLLSLTLIVVKMLQLRHARAGAAERTKAFDSWKSGDKANAKKIGDMIDKLINE